MKERWAERARFLAADVCCWAADRGYTRLCLAAHRVAEAFRRMEGWPSSADAERIAWAEDEAYHEDVAGQSDGKF